jgi:hypothetical protein
MPGDDPVYPSVADEILSKYVCPIAVEMGESDATPGTICVLRTEVALHSVLGHIIAQELARVALGKTVKAIDRLWESNCVCNASHPPIKEYRSSSTFAAFTKGVLNIGLPT